MWLAGWILPMELLHPAHGAVGGTRNLGGGGLARQGVLPNSYVWAPTGDVYQQCRGG